MIIIDGIKYKTIEDAASVLLVAKRVEIDSLPLVTALPDLPSATVVRFYNLPLVTALPDLPSATDVYFDNLPLVTEK